MRMESLAGISSWKLYSQLRLLGTHALIYFWSSWFDAGRQRNECAEMGEGRTGATMEEVKVRTHATGNRGSCAKHTRSGLKTQQCSAKKTPFERLER